MWTRCRASGTKALYVIAAPNLFTAATTLRIESGDKQPVMVTVWNTVGMVVEKKSKVASNTTVPLAGVYASGMYLVEVLQGSNRVVVKLLPQGTRFIMHQIAKAALPGRLILLSGILLLNCLVKK